MVANPLNCSFDDFGSLLSHLLVVCAGPAGELIPFTGRSTVVSVR